LQLLNKYHGNKTSNLSTLDKMEVEKFQAGMSHGSSDANFKKFTDQLKKEGAIKNTEDVKRLFNKNHLTRMSEVLLGRKSSNLFRSVGKAAFNERRALGRTDSKPTKRP
jgi:hypothetical protein